MQQTSQVPMPPGRQMPPKKQKTSGSTLIVLKMVMIGFLTLLLLIPTSMIYFMMEEREDRQEQAVREMSGKWGKNQTIIGPILVVPFEERIPMFGSSETYDPEKHGTQYRTSTHQVYFLPEELKINGDINTETRKRGIYEAVVYNSKVNLQGSFAPLNFEQHNLKSGEALWNEAYLNVSITDLRGMQENVSLSWSGKDLEFKPGLIKNEKLYIGDSGLNVQVPMEGGKSFKFDFDLNINGSQSISFAPLGKETIVELNSPWPSPSFNGAFLPDSREIADSGFSAKWKVLELNRGYSQSWLASANQDISDSAFGVELLILADDYQKNMRSVKYAILFISLTFIVFFFVEVMSKTKIHIIQYLLVGLSLVLFFSLLIAFTEHSNFKTAYAISAIATVALVTLYAKAVFKKFSLAGLLGAILTGIYAFIYTILQMEDQSLLMGSIGLFIILAVIMFVSRKINWYSIGNNKE